MKKRIIQLMLCASIYTNASAQTPANCPPNANAPIAEYCENGLGISTNPANLVNDNCPGLKNNFEWRIKHTPGGNIRDERFWGYFENTNTPSWIRNPFNGPINASYGHLTDNHNSNYQPEDGWELLKVDLGTNGNIGLGIDEIPSLNTFTGSAWLPYFILYNKFSGTLRFFGAVPKNVKAAETILVEIKIPKQSNSDDPYSSNFYFEDLVATNLLSAQGEAVQPLDEESEETQLSIFVKNPKTSTVFFWFDIPVVYDPCICKKRLQMDINIYELYSANIPINNNSEIGIFSKDRDIKKDFGRSLAMGANQQKWPKHNLFSADNGNALVHITGIADALQIVMNLGEINEQERAYMQMMIDNLACNQDIHQITQRILDYEKMQPIIMAESNFDKNNTFLSTTTSGCFRENAGLFSSNFYQVSGDFKTGFTPIKTIKLALPGSNWSDQLMVSHSYKRTNQINPAYPTYNERLGTFALIETPTFKQTRAYAKNTIFVTELTLEDSLRYAFNPLLKVNEEKTKIYVRLAYKGENVPEIQNGYHFEYNPNSQYPLTSKFVPIEYFKNIPLVAEIFENFDPNKLFIQFKILLESETTGTDGKPNSSYLFYTYPVKLEENKNHNKTAKQLLKNDRVKMYTQNKEFDTDVFFDKSQTLSYDGKVRISTKLEVADGEKVKIYATGGFDILANPNLNPNIELIQGYPFEKIHMPTATYSYINDFCNDPKRYKAQYFGKKSLNEDSDEELIDVIIFPNPNNGHFYLKFSSILEEIASLEMYDLSGRKVKERTLLPWGIDQYTIDTQHIANGLYVVKVQTSKGTNTMKILVQK